MSARRTAQIGCQEAHGRSGGKDVDYFPALCQSLDHDLRVVTVGQVRKHVIALRQCMDDKRTVADTFDAGSWMVAFMCEGAESR